MGKGYLTYNGCCKEIEYCKSTVSDIRSYLTKLLLTLNFKEEVINNLKSHKENLNKKDENYETYHIIYDLFKEISSLYSNLDDAYSEADDLEDRISDLESEVEELESTQFDDFKIEPPYGYYDEELLKLAISVYDNRDRLNDADKQILKVLSEKTL